MKLAIGQQNLIQQKMPNNITNDGIRKSPYYNNYTKKDTVSFTSSLLKQKDDLLDIIFKKANGKISCSNASKLTSSLDEIFGDGFFSNKLSTLGNGLANVTDDVLTVQNRGFWRDEFFKTLRFPFYDLPMQLANSVCNALKVENKPKFVTQWLQITEKEKSKDFVLDVLEEFSNRKYGQKINFQDLLAKFQDDVADNISRVKKNYASRDERSMNRMMTSIVSALYSANDFYNISMLEKDDKNEAKKARKGRLKQDLTRMAFNTTTTFIALGMFDRYTKRNVVLNSLVIAGSALFSEITSRILSGTPLKILTPKDAEKIALKREQNNKEIKNNGSNTLPFKSSHYNNLAPYSNFANSQGRFTALDEQQKQILKENNSEQEQNKTAKSLSKKRPKLTKILGLAFGTATVAFFGAKALKGDYKAFSQEKEFLQKYSGSEGLSKLTDETKDIVLEISNQHKIRTKRFSVWGNLKKIITKHKTTVDLVELTSKIDEIQSGNDSKQIAGVLNKYREHIALLQEKLGDKTTFDAKVDTFGVSGIVNGFTKIFKTIYDVLTIPAKALNAGIEKLFGIKDVNKKFGSVVKSFDSNNVDKYKTELSSLYELVKDDKLDKNRHKIIDTIEKRIRNVETGSETGELANVSRTMVTAIGTYFFVNDYRNNVLIESKGKNIEGAKEETNERIMHKIFNFIINGTLMNVFNTTFKNTVNGSVMGATAVAMATEATNEFLVRKSICQPVTRKESRQAIIDFEQEQLNKKGLWGKWTRLFKKITGKKTLTQKAKVNVEEIKK